MVKVIGKDETVVKRVTCRNCASILEYTQSEVQTVNGTDYSGGPDGHDYIVCPSCHQKVILRAW